MNDLRGFTASESVKTRAGSQAAVVHGGVGVRKIAPCGSVFGHVDRASGLVPSRENQHAPHGNILTDHQGELGDFSRRKVFGEFAAQGLTRRTEIQGEFLGKAYRQRVSGLKLSLRRGSMDLLNRLFVESLTRRRRVTCEKSGIALVEGCDFQPREFLDSRGHNAFVVSLSEKREIALEMFRDQLHRIHSATSVTLCGRHADFSSPIFREVSLKNSPHLRV
jgi:hypothetical protein